MTVVEIVLSGDTVEINDNKGLQGASGAGNDGADGQDGAPGAQGEQGVPGVDGLGWTGGSYNASNGIVTFTSDDGLGFSTGDLRGADGVDGQDGNDGAQGAQGVPGNDGATGAQGATGAAGADGNDGADGSDGLGWTGGSYNTGTGIVTFSSTDGLGFSTGDLRGADGNDGAQGAQGIQGVPGNDGVDGSDGQGVPTGGAAGQSLIKSSGTDYDTEWSTPVKLDAAQEFTRAQNFDANTLTDAASIAWNLENSQVTSVTLGGNRTLAAPTNLKNGGTYILTVKQDATGGRTLTFNSTYKFPGGTAPTLSTAANAVDILTFISDGTSLFGVAQLDFS